MTPAAAAFEAAQHDGAWTNRESGVADGVMTALADQAVQITFDVVETAAFLDRLEQQARAQTRTLQALRTEAEAVVAATQAMRSGAETAAAATEAARGVVSACQGTLKSAGDRNRRLAGWAGQIQLNLGTLEGHLRTVESNTSDIASIAKQVNILAINAKIEAGRAGEAGRGFAVVAEAINDLSRQTSTAAESIAEAISSLAMAVVDLRGDSEAVSADASLVLTDAAATEGAFDEIAQEVGAATAAVSDIASQAERAGQTVGAFGPAFTGITDTVTATASDVETARGRVEGLVDTAEGILQSTVAAGAAAADLPLIEAVQQLAKQVAARFETGLEKGQISPQELFSRDYTPIPRTNPQQLTAPFTKFSDQVLPDLLEGALSLDDRVVFCAAVDTSGYLPTHNRKFSHRQGADPVWNAAHCRNRRIFDDRVGLKAGRNRQPFLLQVYRRDMGGGKFAMMKDASAPIVVQERHWGGLRLAFTA